MGLEIYVVIRNQKMQSKFLVLYKINRKREESKRFESVYKTWLSKNIYLLFKLIASMLDLDHRSIYIRRCNVSCIQQEVLQRLLTNGPSLTVVLVPTCKLDLFYGKKIVCPHQRL